MTLPVLEPEFCQDLDETLLYYRAYRQSTLHFIYLYLFLIFAKNLTICCGDKCPYPTMMKNTDSNAGNNLS